ncbi:MAG: 3-phosphoshikimate 1-carboxyvinyltransferase [Actinobacteria bacterium]|nr:3-phosphoshikimate 1-carboxyvinyltransferase [Actinomycetota bacterium]MCZ6630228.1 3-phosphoshikimate 1-carboxyvinyltransferase [Actinomycetota bacterium]
MTAAWRVRTASGPVDGAMRPPGSKSATIRALAVAALAEGRSHIYGALRADDTVAMIGVLRSFGIAVDDRGEPWAVDGTGGRLQAPKAALDVLESGLTARIAMVLASLVEGRTVVDGRGHLRQRPIDALVRTLTDQGVRVTTTVGFLPASIDGLGGLWGGEMTVDCSKSSQFATALLIAAPMTSEPTRLRVEGLEGSFGYLALTLQVMDAFGAEVSRTFTGFEVANSGYRPTDYVVEPDASSAVYPMVAAAITGGRVELEGLTRDSEHPDLLVARRLGDMGCAISEEKQSLVVDAYGVTLKGIETDMSAAPDGALALVVACLFADGVSRINGLASLRFKESDRLSALSNVLSSLGGSVSIEDECLVIRPVTLAGATIDPHGDHRIAMSCALVGLRVDGVSVADPDVVDKTWPGYWEMLEKLASGAGAAAPR